MVGINNTGATFPMAFLFIILELAKFFKFASKYFTNLVFYNCLEPAVILGDFSKDFAAAILRKAKVDT